MNFETYKDKIIERLSMNFDVEEQYTYNNKEFDFFAASNVRNERFMASKKLTIYAFENDEYCLMKHFKELDNRKLEEIVDTLKKSVKDLVSPHSEHMSSTITGILVVDNIKDSELIKKIKKFNYQKSFALGFKGWADVRLVLVDLEEGNVFTSKKANKVDKFYQP